MLRGMSEAWFDANREMWDERVGIHVDGSFYDVEDFKRRPDRIRDFEAREVGDVTGRTLVHLQCHFGIDTLSWATRGASVVGLDFSPEGVAAARALAVALGIEAKAEFVEGNVYDAVEALGGRQFDVVYTGLGALNWLPDLGRWAGTAAALVKPGGFLYVAEFHPILWSFAEDDMSIELDYFQTEPYVDDRSGTYADLAAATEHNVCYEWQHTLGDVVSTIIDAGLTVELLHEHDYTLFPRWPWLVKSEFDRYEFPTGRPRLPLMFSVRARKAAA